MGLHPDAKLQFVEDAYIREKKFEEQMKRTDDMMDLSMLQRRKPKPPMMDPQVWLLKDGN